MQKKILLISDLDGTLLDEDKKISKENLQAIDEFIQAGGYFTIATGRGKQMSQNIIDILQPKLPVVILNGGAVYDYQNRKYLWNTNLKENARIALKLIMEKFPYVGIEILHPDYIYIPQSNELTTLHMGWEELSPCFCTFEEIPQEGWLKALLACDKDKMDEVIEFVHKHCADAGHWVRSADIFFELLPEGVNKATGLKKLIELTNNEDAYVIAIGDYNNDIEMLQMADYGVAVENAMEEVKRVADLVVTDHNHHAIATLLKHLKKYPIN